MSTISGVTIQPVLRGITSKDDVVRAEVLDAASTWDAVGTDEDGSPWSARLFLWPGAANPPSWLGFLQDGFGDDVVVPDATRSKAVIVMAVRWYGAERLFVVAFGDGRHQLRRSALDFAAARKVQLNVIYEGDDAAGELATAPRIRDIEYVERGETTMRTRRQAGRNSDFDQFDFDPDVDQLVGVTGVPIDQAAFGGRISGKTSLRLSRTIDFPVLAGICRNVARYEGKKDYQRRFEFVDRVTEITTPASVQALDEALTHALKDDGLTGWEFAPPEMIDFDYLSTVRLEHPDLGSVDLDGAASAAEMLAALEGVGLADIDVEELYRVRVVGLGPDDEQTGSWTLQECLEGQLTVDDDTFLLSAGRYSAVAADFVAAVNQRLAAMELSAVVLPDSHFEGGKEVDEGQYNVLAASTSDDFLLMDKRNVVVSGKTSPIEVCDLLTMQRQLVHVKRKFSSATLSHLFSQGETSGVLLVDSAEFRAAVRNKIQHDPAGFGEMFGPAFRPGDFEIVYAIVGDWQGGGLVDRLPFFSKVNLLNRARQLRRMGYRVTYAAVGVS